jgi:hypothetical protein
LWAGIGITGLSDILLFDASGRLVKRFDPASVKVGVSDYELNVQDMEEGIYYVKVITSDARNFYKTLVVRKR